MAVYHATIPVHTPYGIWFEDVTDKVVEAVNASGIKNGIVCVFSQHTSCSVLIQEDSEGVTYNNISLFCPYYLLKHFTDTCCMN